MEIELKPCECGGRAIPIGDNQRRRPYRIICNAYACPASTRWCDFPEEAREEWNAATTEPDNASRKLRSALAREKFWLRAARKALAGDMSELRTRVELIDAPPLPIVLSAATTEPGERFPIATQYRLRLYKPVGDKLEPYWSEWRDGHKPHMQGQPDKYEERFLYLHTSPPSTQPSKDLVYDLRQEARHFRKFKDIGTALLLERAATALAQPPVTDPNKDVAP